MPLFPECFDSTITTLTTVIKTTAISTEDKSTPMTTVKLPTTEKITTTDTPFQSYLVRNCDRIYHTRGPNYCDLYIHPLVVSSQNHENLV